MALASKPPMALIVWVFAMFTFQLLIAGSAPVEDLGFPEFPAGEGATFQCEGTFCFDDVAAFITDFVTALFQVPLVFLKLLTFSYIDGMPAFIQYFLTFTVSFPILWFVAVIIFEIIQSLPTT